MTDNETASRATLRAAILEVVAGPVPLDELTTVLAERGLLDHVGQDRDSRIDEVIDSLTQLEGIWVSGNDVVFNPDRATHDLAFTHRVSADELARQMLDAVPDLAMLDQVHDVLEARGGRVERIWPEGDPFAAPSGSFKGPDGWLGSFAAGDLVALRRTGRTLRIERVDQNTLGDGAREREALRQTFECRVDGPGIGQLVDDVVLDALAGHTGLFTEPVPPIGELFAAVDLDCRTDWVGPAGAEWVPPYIAEQIAQLEVLADRYELDDCCLGLFERVMEVWNEFVVVPDADDFPWTDIAGALWHGSVAAAFADGVLGVAAEPDPRLDAFARRLRDARTPPASAVGNFLLARNLERGGDATSAEAHLFEAVRHDPSYEPALDDLAWYLADRGDADQALNMLRRAGVIHTDPQIQLLESMRAPRNLAGRNERCPCGSGRKYKDCCQRKTTLPLERRAAWLEHKLWSFTLRPQRQELPLTITVLMASDDDEDDDLYEMLGGGLPMDLAAFELGLAHQFLAERGALLPDDERQLLQSWLDRPRRLYEIVERVSNASLVVRDLTTDELIALSGFDAAERSPGSLLLARVAPLEGSNRFVGVPVDVPGELRGSAAALVASQPDAWAIARWLGEASE